MHVLVTGGSSGIGAATALAYARTGADVTITYNQGADRAAEIVRRVEKEGVRGAAVHLDLEDHSTIAPAVAQTGPVDALVANAVRWGTVQPGSMAFEDVPAAEWSAALHANVAGNALLIQAVLPEMRRRQWGRIVLVSSGIAEEGVPGPGPYGTAKMALHGMARALAWEAGKDGILVNVAVAGLTVTGVRAFPQEVLDRLAARTPSRRLSTADDMAALIVFLGSAANHNVTGEIIRDGSNAGRSAHAL
ncbi:3-oxoacyl-[acyl-carrier protein] reductase [[Actinomadura] parvosata subsp. kistnae]|uniref:Short-chain dehydrogenase n=1 Tax=[Actinomadura] parvosata subsp. kistnae TaxID=1909395 RepID=A0A1V0ADK9_9ACTN|nr:SDR family oxidoreductase [Nonomuraea sp. ATCC 55076]AQZ68287.1 short-chain dehydrogenase [Nonomuraea sp. ATCC 55076]SPL93293.1 3-oxoacyl-[acyl-carrier protein] reductase [Actinomadura parvosata subsp. kistnae]